jgi:S-DNA-T family DNA segregation ATPase FtsK/SpoIIIE
LLASQRLEAGMLRGLDTFLSYWIGMRTFSEAESRSILGTADAFTLPSVPGYGYLKVDTSVYTRFRAAYVSGPVEDEAEPPSRVADDQVLAVQTVPLFDAPAAAPVLAGEEELAPPDVGRLLVDEAVGRLTSPSATAPIWLPPLPGRLTLGTLLAESGLPAAGAGLAIPIGLLDDPQNQSQAPWMLDLGARGGLTAIVGAPQSGRSTFLRTIVVSLALRYTPQQVSIYGLDMTGGGMDRISSFPHVGGVATRADRARLARLFEGLHAMIREREVLFRNQQIDNLAELRRRHARGAVGGLVAPDIVVVVDGVDPLRNEFDDLDQPFTELLQRGPTFGLHVVMALTRWNELRTQLQPLVGQRFELRLNDPNESTIQRSAALAIKSAGPGRVLTQELRYGQVGLPILDEVEHDSDIGDAVAALGQRYARSWSGPKAAPIRLLPEVLDPATLPDQFDCPDAVPFGIRQDTFEAVSFDPALDLHLLVFGDTRCGKTTLLRGLAQGFMKRWSADELVFGVIDPRGTLAAAIPEPYLGGRAANARDALALCTGIAAELEKSQATPGATLPRVVILVDDYDIVAAGQTRPLAPLMAFLPSARDLKLSVIVARPVAGAGRSLYDPAIQAIRDAGGSGLVMSGERSEGPLFPKIYAEPFPPGRGRFVRRSAVPRIIQVANFE